jgi:TctA family transporter
MLAIHIHGLFCRWTQHMISWLLTIIAVFCVADASGRATKLWAFTHWTLAIVVGKIWSLPTSINLWEHHPAFPAERVSKLAPQVPYSPRAVPIKASGRIAKK